MSRQITIRDGIGWVADEHGLMHTAELSDYVAEIERLRAALQQNEQKPFLSTSQIARSALGDEQK